MNLMKDDNVVPAIGRVGFMVPAMVTRSDKVVGVKHSHEKNQRSCSWSEPRTVNQEDRASRLPAISKP